MMHLQKVFFIHGSVNSVTESGSLLRRIVFSAERREGLRSSVTTWYLLGEKEVEVVGSRDRVLLTLHGT